MSVALIILSIIGLIASGLVCAYGALYANIENDYSAYLDFLDTFGIETYEDLGTFLLICGVVLVTVCIIALIGGIVFIKRRSNAGVMPAPIMPQQSYYQPQPVRPVQPVAPQYAQPAPQPVVQPAPQPVVPQPEVQPVAPQPEVQPVPQQSFCGACGAQIQAGDKFCNACGAPVEQ